MTQKYQVKVSMKQAAIVETGIVLKQGDFGMEIEIEVLDFDATGTTPQIVFRKAMGAVESTTITVSGNKYTYTFKGTELDTPGKCICDLKLKNSTTQRISTASFMFKVVADTLDGLTEEANSYSDTIAQIVGNFNTDTQGLYTLVENGGICDTSTVAAGTTPGISYYTGTTGESTTSYVQTVNVKGYDQIRFHASAYAGNQGYFWTDEDGSIIQGEHTGTKGELFLDIPESAISLTTCWRKTEDQEFTLYKYVMKNDVNELKETNFSYLEDLRVEPISSYVVSNNNGKIKISGAAPWQYLTIPVNAGDKFYINTMAYGNSYYCILYADSESNVLSEEIKPGVSQNVPVENYLSIAPTGATVLYVNQRVVEEYTASIIQAKSDISERFKADENVTSNFELSAINSDIVQGKVIIEDSGKVKESSGAVWKYISSRVVGGMYLKIKTIAYGSNRYPVIFADASGNIISMLYLLGENTETVIEKTLYAPAIAAMIYVNCRKSASPDYVPYIKGYTVPADIGLAKGTLSGEMINDYSIPPQKLSECYSIKNIGLPMMDAARAKIVELNKANKYFNFMFITDTHVMGNEGVDLDRTSKNNIRLFSMMANEKWANCCVHGGDLYTSYNLDNAAAAKTIDDALRPLEHSQIPVYITKGNHDTNGKYKAPVTPAEQANPDWENNTYYIQSDSGSYGYLEVTEGTWDGTSQLYKLDNDERITKYQWFLLTENNLDVARNTDDVYAGYYYKDFENEKVRIIILNSYEPEQFEQSGFSDDQIEWLCETALNTTNTIVVITHFKVPNNLFKNFVNGETYTNGSYSYDFSTQSVRNFAGVIHGHTHLDEYSSTKGYNYIGCDCGFCEEAALDSVNEYCFTVFTVDTDEQRIYSTRIGRGGDHVYSYDTPGQIDTSTAEGNPLNFTSRYAQNALSTSISMEPIQDLHGFTKPWAGGAGKNLFPIDITRIKQDNTAGTWSGNKYTYQGIVWEFLFDNDNNCIGVDASGTNALTGNNQVYINIDADTIPEGNYYFSGSPDGGNASNTYNVYMWDWTTNSRPKKWDGTTNAENALNSSDYREVKMVANHEMNVTLRIYGSYAISGHIVFKPMICASNATNPAQFEPYENICPISGRSSVDIDGCGKNVLEIVDGFNKTPTGTTLNLKTQSNGEILLNGTNGSSDAVVIFNLAWLSSNNSVQSDNKKHILNGTYKCSGLIDGMRIQIRGSNSADAGPGSETSIGVFIDNTSTVIVDSTFSYNWVRLLIKANASFNNQIIKPMIYLATDTNTYEPYNKNTDLTISLGQTVYGARHDVENGVLVVDKVYAEINGTKADRMIDGSTVDSQGGTEIATSIIAKSPLSTTTIANIIADRASADTALNLFNNPTPNTIGVTSSGNIALRYKGANTLSDAQSALNSEPINVCYELATPITIQLTPQVVNLLKGVNNISTDGDKITLTYSNV